jgi:hypothetical protein
MICKSFADHRVTGDPPGAIAAVGPAQHGGAAGVCANARRRVSANRAVTTHTRARTAALSGLRVIGACSTTGARGRSANGGKHSTRAATRRLGTRTSWLISHLGGSGARGAAPARIFTDASPTRTPQPHLAAVAPSENRQTETRSKFHFARRRSANTGKARRLHKCRPLGLIHRSEVIYTGTRRRTALVSRWTRA